MVRKQEDVHAVEGACRMRRSASCTCLEARVLPQSNGERREDSAARTAAGSECVQARGDPIARGKRRLDDLADTAQLASHLQGLAAT